MVTKLAWENYFPYKESNGDPNLPPQCSFFFGGGGDWGKKRLFIGLTLHCSPREWAHCSKYLLNFEFKKYIYYWQIRIELLNILKYMNILKTTPFLE